MPTETFYVARQIAGGHWFTVDTVRYEQKDAAVAAARERLAMDEKVEAVRVVRRMEETVWSERAAVHQEVEEG